MFSIRVYQTEKGKMVAACDHYLLGETFKEGKVRLHLKKDFYHREKVEFNKVKNELEDAKIANLVGENLIERLIEEGIVNSDEVKSVEGTPHVQIFVI